MAKQKGFLKIEGSLGDTTFLKAKSGYLAKQKSEISASKIKNDPKFERTRENMSEFSKAGKAGKLVRTVADAVSKTAKDQTSIGRLVKNMLRIVQSDAVSARGQRKAGKGNAKLLEGFNFNQAAEFSTVFNAPFDPAIDRVTGALTINIPSFIPAITIDAPSGATHFKIVSAGAELDFDNDVVNRDINESAFMPLDYSATPVIDLINTVTANSTHALGLFIGIQYFVLTNGVHYPLKGSAFNSLCVVKVS